MEYEHGSGDFEGSSVIGGYVYRGPVESLWGQYIFGDFINGNLWSIPVTDLAGTIGDDGKPVATLGANEMTLLNTAFDPDTGDINSPSSFGEDPDGNLYIVDYDGDIFMVEATMAAPQPTIILGDGGRNKLKDTDGDDTLMGLGDRDKLSGKAGDDFFDGGAGADSIKDREGSNTALGQGGDDKISMGDGNDTIDGGFGNDRISDRGGVNTIDGGAGDDRIKVKDGTNTITGGAGTDDIRLGKGDDTFVFNEGDGVNTVRGFKKSGADKIDVSDFMDLDFDDLIMSATQEKKNTILDSGDGDQLILLKVEIEDLQASDFIFADM